MIDNLAWSIKSSDTRDEIRAKLRAVGHPGGWPIDTPQFDLAYKMWSGELPVPAYVMRGEISTEEYIGALLGRIPEVII